MEIQSTDSLKACITETNKAFLTISFNGANQVWQEILSYGSRCLFPCGHDIPCSYDQGFYYVASGSLQLVYIAQGGQQRILITIGAGSLFNELPVLTQTNLDTAFHCKEAVEAWRFPSALLHDTAFISSYPHLIHNLMQSMAAKSGLFFSYSSSGMFANTEQQVCQLLYRLYQEQGQKAHMAGISQTDVANMLGVHQTTLARTVRRLRTAGIVGKFTKNHIELLDIPRLISMAQDTP